MTKSHSSSQAHSTNEPNDASQRDNSSSDISPLLASSIHEIKNQFATLVLHIEDILGHVQQEKHETGTEKIRGEINLISHRLSEMLGSYKTQGFSIAPNIDQQVLDDLFDDIATHHKLTEKTYNLTIKYECDEDIFGFFDERLIQNVIDTAIYNAAQTNNSSTATSSTTKPVSEILISANWNDEKQNGEEITIYIEDNGPGFPEEMLQNHTSLTPSTSLKMDQMKCGLGLYLADQIAYAHEREGQHGHIELLNARSLPGACLAIHLP